jgi:excinuclease ABC subunit C
VRRLNHLFELRDCPPDTPLHFSDQGELFPQARAPLCLRHDLGSCPAPCAAGCSTCEYAARVADALAFLRGMNNAPLDRLEAEMNAAATARQFERAALLRDNWGELSWMNEQLERARESQTRYSFVYPLPGHGRRRDWYLIRRGQLVGALAAPRDRRSARRCLARLEAIYSDGSEQPPEDTDLLWLVCRWFRGREKALATTLSPEEAAVRCEQFIARRKAK